MVNIIKSNSTDWFDTSLIYACFFLCFFLINLKQFGFIFLTVIFVLIRKSKMKFILTNTSIFASFKASIAVKVFQPVTLRRAWH